MTNDATNTAKKPRLSAGLLVILGLGFIALLTVAGLIVVNQYVSANGQNQASEPAADTPQVENEDGETNDADTIAGDSADADSEPATDADVEDTDEAGDSDETESDPAEIEGLPDVDLPVFIMPSRNVACAGQHGSVTCTIAEKDYSFPGESECEFGMGIELAEQTELMCLDEAWMQLVYDEETPVLGYGEQTEFGPITCYSRDTGINCGHSDGASFTLRRSHYAME